MSLRIGITRGENLEKYRTYVSWLEASGIDLEIVDLNRSTALADDVGRLHGLLFSGGSDVDPARYGKEEETSLCRDIDQVRDELEFRALEQAEERSLPILGICRGLQVINIAKGGTLVPDIATARDGDRSHEKEREGLDRRHAVTVTPGSILYKAVGETEGEVNSAHHQAIDQTGEGLVITARAADGTPEAIERLDPMGKPWLLGVQWHPERMVDQENPFAHTIRERFLFEAESARALIG